MNKNKAISIVLVVLVVFLAVGAVNYVMGIWTAEPDLPEVVPTPRPTPTVVPPSPEPILPGTYITVFLNRPVTTNELLILGQYMEIRSYGDTSVFGILKTGVEKIKTLDFVRFVSGPIEALETE